MLARSERKSRTLFFFQSDIFFLCGFGPVRGDSHRVWLCVLWRIRFTIYWIFFQKLFVITPSFSCQFFQDIISRPAAVCLTPLNGSSFSPALKIETATFRRERRGGGGGRTWTEQIMFSAHIICLPGDHTKARENWGRDEKRSMTGRQSFIRPLLVHPRCASLFGPRRRVDNGVLQQLETNDSGEWGNGSQPAVATLVRKATLKNTWEASW